MVCWCRITTSVCTHQLLLNMCTIQTTVIELQNLIIFMLCNDISKMQYIDILSSLYRLGYIEGLRCRKPVMTTSTGNNCRNIESPVSIFRQMLP